MLLLGIETSTPQTSVALGTEQGLVASAVLGGPHANHEAVIPTVQQLLSWSDARLASLAGVAVGVGPGLFTGMRVGVASAKTLAQVLGIPVVGMASLDILAFSVRHARGVICAAIDAKRGETFYAFYRAVPGGVARQSGFEAATPAQLAAELQARPEDVLVVGNGGLVYRRELEEAGSHVEVATATFAFPSAAALVELAIPRFQREEFDRVDDLAPLYIRKSDAEIAWDQRRTG
ncbi:MAG TPA: tRNA (adenosine(37)-N6)-threonylcarbamoyltransferase complex dimerization subunit type 1 TsaB [Actinomycetota bacterium]|nr:tRNA (adenosine(37)-N6)-threonylcarbamoyltransferase complex dimerization subunit type 1 TsaB [Actinomycetota bacterium]